MKTIERELDIQPVNLRMMEPYFKGMSYGVFDIETTGLSPAYSRIMLSGFVIVRDGRATLKQFFATHPSQEEEVIRATLAEIADLSYLVTFNGKMFDLPFLIKRAAKYGLPEPFEPPTLLFAPETGSDGGEGSLNLKAKYDLDIFVIMKYYSDLGKILESMSQKSLERYMGIAGTRSDEISGLDSVKLYNDYVSFPTPEAEEVILLHNSDDVCQLTRLIGILTRSDFHRALSKNGFPVNGGMVKSVSQDRNGLTIKGFAARPMEYFSFPSAERPYNFYMSGTDGAFEINVPCETEGGSVYLDLLPLLSAGASHSAESKDSSISIPREIAELPGFTNGYLIISGPDGSGKRKTDWLALNIFARHLTNMILASAQE